MNGIISGKSGINGGAKGLLVYETVTTISVGGGRSETFTVPFYPVMITIRATSQSIDSIAYANFAIRESKYNTTTANFWSGGNTYTNCIITWKENTITVKARGGGDINTGSPVIILGY